MSNIWIDEWESTDDWSGGRARSRRVVGGEQLGASLYELDQGCSLAYHFHHGSEELLVVLRGTPTLRTAAGERALAAGDVVHFPAGPAGVHGLRNDVAEPARVLMSSTYASPEVVEYPEHGHVTAQARTASVDGQPLWLLHDRRGS